MSGYKRQREDPPDRYVKKTKVNPNLQSKIQQAKENLRRKRQQAEKRENEPAPSTLSSIEIHPLLRGDSTSLEKSKPSTPVVKNPLKNSKGRQGFILNPYISQQDIAAAPPRPKRELHLNQKGKFIEQANEIRSRLKKEQLEKERIAKLAEQNLVSDIRLGEQFYKPVEPPYIEWWDKPFLKDKFYDNLDDESRTTFAVQESEDNPITIHIQHPVPIVPVWAANEPPPKTK
ncbi:unnamed protein product [Ambrosiozyma monospora]|uniref:Unnamed protein product n=1 Tax=Ambrosiozyma monospora TaxID=43982 RepID=A0A9W6SZG6_AMBMO|nr:unnamed protein product [Ambrosiozyma monospora]